MTTKVGSITLVLPDEAATASLAEDVAAVLAPGDLVALSGGLGAGKTSFARALLRALSDNPALEVPSPTFPLRIDHPTPRFPVVHADLYRLGEASELAELGLDEAAGEAALVVEWPERLPDDLAPERLDIALAIDGTARRADIVAHGSWAARLARSARIRAFLNAAGLAHAHRTPMTGDASVRAYERVQHANGSAVLMNAPARAEGPAGHDGRSYDAVAHRSRDVRAFVAVDIALRAAGLRAPAIEAADMESGLLLLEDMGGKGILDTEGAPLLDRYAAAVDVLVAMHSRIWPTHLPLPGGASYEIPPYDDGALLVEVSLFPDWFAGAGAEAAGEALFPKERRGEFLAAWARVLERLGPERTLVMRDFHSPNILWQADAEGSGRVGLIDFQDALIGHPAYDLASLAQDARVDMPAEAEGALTARYVAARRTADSGFDAESFEASYRILALQRATKVLGIFTRLALAEGKPGYQRHRARLKALIHRNLAHPVLIPLRLWYEPYL